MREPNPEAPFSARETEALAAWPAASAPAGWAEQVVARFEAERRARRRVFMARVAAAGAAMLALLVARGQVRWPTSGSVTATTRATVDVGPRGTVVAEPGTQFDWAASWSGDTVVTQHNGSVFYRVEPQSHFDVQTPAGRVRVTGTCFRIEVNDMNRTTIQAAAAGAAVASVAWLTVFEGRVLASSATGGDETAVSAGQSATLSSTGAVVQSDLHAPRAAGAEPNEPGRRGADLTGPSGTVGDTARSDPRPGDVAMLRARVQELERALQTQAQAAQKNQIPPVFDLSPEELKNMAEHCELAWDLVDVDANRTPTLAKDDAQALALTDAQTKQVDAVLADYNRAMIERIRALYVEITHDPAAGSMAVRAMIDEAVDKTPAAERQRAFQRLSAERATGQAPPADLAATPAFERLFRLQIEAGDELEAQLGGALGPGLARQLRERHHGFGSKHRSGDGCPSAQ